MSKSAFPWPGLLLAIFGLVLARLAGVGALVLGLIAVLWLASLVAVWWRMADTLPGVPRAIANNLRSPKVDRDAVARAAIDATIEAISVPLLVTDHQLIWSANAAARAALGGHIVGQAPRIALRHPDAVKLLDTAETEAGPSSVAISGLTGSGSLWQLRRSRIVDGQWAIELRDRTSEADIGRAQTDFVANASHELRTPLSSIIGYVETIAEDPGRLDVATTQRFLGTVLREARRMQSLVSDLMSLSQLEAEKHDVPTTRFELGQLASRVVGEFAPPPGGSERVRLTRADQPLEVAGDVKQVEQLLRNLIDNGLKYGDPDQVVSVTVKPGPRNMAEFAVVDRGPGIAPDHLPHLTRRFYRTDPGRSRAAGGTGLGLAIVKHIVERHRGKLDIASTVGVGTTVCVRLPQVKSEKSQKPDQLS